MAGVLSWQLERACLLRVSHLPWVPWRLPHVPTLTNILACRLQAALNSTATSEKCTGLSPACTPIQLINGTQIMLFNDTLPSANSSALNTTANGKGIQVRAGRAGLGGMALCSLGILFCVRASRCLKAAWRIFHPYSPRQPLRPLLCRLTTT